MQCFECLIETLIQLQVKPFVLVMTILNMHAVDIFPRYAEYIADFVLINHCNCICNNF